MSGIVTTDDKKRNRLRASGNVSFPACYGLEMQHVRTDIETGKHLYRCPEDNHIPEGQMLPCLGEVEVDPGEDIACMAAQSAAPVLSGTGDMKGAIGWRGCSRGGS